MTQRVNHLTLSTVPGVLLPESYLLFINASLILKPTKPTRVCSYKQTNSQDVAVESLVPALGRVFSVTFTQKGFQNG